ncbi:MAG TPA: secretin N-terminal domain-containing protein [Thermoanaerobaculia bacterium]|nr:secretin N-terminal domain-containing protein [Thermoanaerobaculia bacterium]
MKRIILVLLFTTTLFAQEEAKKEPEYNIVREYKNKVFTVQHHPVRFIYNTIRLLGSGFKGAEMSFNEELKTLTVRDYPENLAAIEEAIKRLDQPAPKQPDIDMKIAVLIASKTALPAADVPDELAPVVKQLKATLQYSHYGVMTSSVHRTKLGDGIEGSGVAEPTLLGMTASQERPIFYTYNLRRITAGKGDPASIEIERFAFSMRVPLELGNNNVQYQSVGFETPVAIRQGEKVVIGTTTMKDKALVVVVTASVN